MDKVPDIVKKALGDLANNKDFSVEYIRNVDGFNVYYVKPAKSGCYGFPLMVIKKNGNAKLIDSRDQEGLRFWKAIATQIK